MPDDFSLVPRTFRQGTRCRISRSTAVQGAQVQLHSAIAVPRWSKQQVMSNKQTEKDGVLCKTLSRGLSSRYTIELVAWHRLITSYIRCTHSEHNIWED